MQHRLQGLERHRAGCREVDDRLRMGEGNLSQHPPKRPGLPVRPLRGPFLHEGMPQRCHLQGRRVRRGPGGPGQVRGLPQVLRGMPLRIAQVRQRRAGRQDEQVHHVRRSPCRGHAARLHRELPATCLRLWPARRAHREVRRRASVRGHARAGRDQARFHHLEPTREDAAHPL